MRRSLIIGVSGQVGRQLFSVLGPDAHIACRDPQHNGAFRCDLEELADRPDEADALLSSRTPDAVYCPAAMTNVDACEAQPDLARRLNCDGPAALARSCAHRCIPFIYFSTDYIFDGEAGPYSEDSVANPINAYGKSKLRGERKVLEVCPDTLIVRTTGVYGHDPRGKNFLYGLRRSLSRGLAFSAPRDQISTPTYNHDVARIAVMLVKAGVRGIVNISGTERLSRAEWARRAARTLGYGEDRIMETTTRLMGQPARRPLEAGLIATKLLNLLPHAHISGLDDSVRSWAASEAA